MAIKKTVLGRIPTYAGPWDSNYVNPKTGHNGYPLKKRVTLYGSEFQSKVEDNTYAPATLNAAGTQITFDTTHWEIISNGSDAYLFSNQATATMNVLQSEMSSLEAGAAAGAAAVQPGDLATVATSGDYDDLLNKPTIPTVPTNVSSFTNDAGYLTSHQDITGKAEVSTTVTSVSYDTTNKKITKTINGATTDVVTVSTIKTDLNLSKNDVGLNNVTNDAQIPATEKGVANGVATLDENGLIPSDQLPSFVDDIVELVNITDTAPSTCSKGDWYFDTSTGKLYKATAANTWGVTAHNPEKSKIYFNKTDEKSYRWSGSAMVATPSSDFTGIKVGSSGSTLTPSQGVITIPEYETGADVTDAENVKAALNVVTTSQGKFLKDDGTWDTPQDTTYVFNTAYDATTNKAATMADIPSSLPANGGNSATVNNHSVAADVPANAVFTDTTYESKSAASGGTDVSLVTTGEKYIWNNKQDAISDLQTIRNQAANAAPQATTYTKTEVNGLVDTPHQEYVTVDAYANLPATGSKDTIYRVSNYNGSTSQVDTSVYSEYAWDGSQYVFLCVKSQIGEVFDISVYNNNAKYADLAAALNGGANIPQSLQKGGMSVKFVQSSDNKYVQYRYMESDATTAATFTNVANWQGVDEEPTAGSDNLVKSGGVYNNVSNLEKDVIGTITIDYTCDSTSLDGGYNTSNHRWEQWLKDFGYYSKLIPVSSGKYTITPESGTATSWAFVTATPQSGQDLSFASGQIYHLAETEETSISTPEDAVYLVVTYSTNSSENLKLPIITYLPKHISLADATKAIDDIQVTVGNVRTQNYGSSYDNFYGELTEPSIAAFTVANSECDSDGYISEIHITTNASGTLTFMVGLLDQRRNAVNTRTFDVTIPNAGVNDIKLDTPVYIRAGEQLFVFTDANIPTLKYKNGSNSTDADVQVMVSGGGFPGGGYANYMTYYEQDPTAFHYGVVVDFNYTVKSLHDSLFEEKADADITKKQVESLSNAVQSAGIVYDNSGLPYRIIVVNNQLVPKSLVYKKVVALGNSLTAHQDYPSIGWTSGGDYSMASTRIEVSWTRQLQKILRTINGNSTAIVTPYSIYAWETNPAIEPANIADSHGTYLSDVLTQDVDCVIFRAGENNANTTQTQTDYENGLTSLVNYIKQLCPTADIVITSLMWPNTLKDAAFYNVANTMGLRYVISGSVGNNSEALGDYCLNVDNTTYFPIINSGVAGHVNDYGFYLFANILANSFGLTPLEEVYDIEVQSNVEYYVNRTKGVYQGLITIQTFGNNQPTINVVDSNSTPISVNHFDMSGVSLPSSMANKPTWCSVFEMPNSDVTISIGDI